MEATTTRWMFKRIFPLGLFRLIPERPIKKVITQEELDRLDAQRLREQLETARKYFPRYGKHDEGCKSPCSCGLDNILAQIGAGSRPGYGIE